MSAIQRHLRVNRERAEELTEWLACRAFGNGLQFHLYSRKNDLEALNRLRRGMREMKLALNALTPAARDHLAWPENEADLTVHKFFSDLDQHADEIEAQIRETISDVGSSNRSPPGYERMNIDGISLVDGACFLWRTETGKEPPKTDLNPASKLAKFLDDLFEDFGVKGNARSAFRAWRCQIEPNVHT